MRVHELQAPVKHVLRSKGRSAVAAAAYRSGACIMDERTGIVHDFSRKKGIEAAALILPDNAPEYAHDRAKLWNSAEKIEKHPRAQTARDMTVSFPSEFSAEQRREAGHRIGQWIMLRHGAAVDVAWHEPSKQGDQRNHHAHFLFTTRRFDEKGEWAKTKDRTLDEMVGKDGQPARGPEEIKAMRLAVADVMNDIAVRDKLPVYVEHLSYEKRGLDREATQHMGPNATEMERRGQVTEIGNKNREIKARNAERARLEQESKVIDIEVAREQLRQKGQQQAHEQAARAMKRDPYLSFYRETHTRRAAMLEALDRDNGQQEKELQQECARLNQSITGANVLVRAWRHVSGRAKQDKERLAKISASLETLRQRKEMAYQAFEADRLNRLEQLKEQQRQEAERTRTMLLQAKVVGNERSPAPAPVRPDYEARRDAFMARQRRQRAAERQPTPPSASTSVSEKAAAPPVPTNDIQSAAPKPRPDYEARRDAFMARRRRERGNDKTPGKDKGPSLEP